MKRIWWLRHGPTHAKGMIGWTDVPADLSDTGRIDRLTAWLPNVPVVSSDLLRAVETADAIAGSRCRLKNAPDLREFNFGAWEGRRTADIEAESPDLIRAFWDGAGDVRPPHGESWNDLAARVSAAADRLLDEAGGDLIAVAHMGAILTQLQRALALSPVQTMRHRIDNLSVTQLTFHSFWRAETINHCP